MLDVRRLLAKLSSVRVVFTESPRRPESRADDPFVVDACRGKSSREVDAVNELGE